jgi:hypothetical protein
LAEGVTVIMPEIPEPVVLVAVKAGVFPPPDAVKPTAGFVFVQLYVVLATLPEKAVDGTATPLQ